MWRVGKKDKSWACQDNQKLLALKQKNRKKILRKHHSVSLAIIFFKFFFIITLIINTPKFALIFVDKSLDYHYYSFVPDKPE